MAIKSILCVFGGLKDELNALNTAFTLGKACGAHLQFLHVSPDPASYVGLYGEGFAASAPIIEAIEKENEVLAQKAKQYVVSFAAKHHVPLDVPDSPLHHASAQFSHLIGSVEGEVAREGRLSDLVIISQGAASDSAVISALFDTGRPVLVMPVENRSLPSELVDKVIVLAWDGGLEAARAMFNAMPFIEKAEKVHLLVAREHSKAFDLEAESDAIQYLRTHGFQADAVVVEIGDRAIGKVLLTEAHKLKADILVMGAYGHSRFREMVLGGVTDYMLEKADIPLLLSH
jgi:nucleotide-binding universal stress UspA family protein